MTFTNTKTVEATPVEVELKASKTYKINGETQTLTADQFKFTLTEKGKTSALQTKGNATDGSVTFDKLTFDQEGTYEYVVAEKAGSDSSITYDNTSYAVNVEVTKNTADNKLEAEVTVDGTAGKAMTFTNTKTVVQPTTGSLKIIKNVTLDGATTTTTDVDGTYKFVVKDSEGKTVAEPEITISNGNSESVIVKDLLAGTYTVSEDVSNLPDDVSLAGSNDGSNDIEVTVVAGVNADSTEIPTVAFTNNKTVSTEQSKATIKITKTIEGDVTDEDLEGLTFVVSKVDGDTRTIVGEYPLNTFDKISDGKYEKTITVEADDTSSVTYEIVETLYTLDGKTVEVTYNVDGVGEQTGDTSSVTLDKDGSVTVAFKDVYKNLTAKIQISKLDAVGKKEIEGAQLEIFSSDEKGNPVGDFSKKWKSTKTVETFELGEGTYTIRELIAPEGYEKTENFFIFKVVYANDELKVIQISDDHLPGTYDEEAGLIAFENDPIKVDNKTEDDTTETTTEKTTETTTESTTETTTETTTENTTEVTTETDDVGNLIVTVVERDTERVVPGAEVEIVYPDGTVKTYTTDDKGQITLKEIPVGGYSITVRKVPNGYNVVEGETGLCTVTAGATADHKSKIVTKKTTDNVVSTNDPTQISAFLIAMLISAAGMVFFIGRKRKLNR